ncbi:TIGR02450 family Trp-rich protein [Prochlorococcus marinus]|uniref:TIGR02450 family Trp-rich protein n=1 Tax=Prochlorococcus marinus TaxID=1219 RepID=UPI001AD96375|nr:TIGR02450 family Trp-rich protein [Prochlorococcus marinus]MBO8220701.1 TIGR02450 family Trp-rich protein [Prochlorococcus marinus CUG1417]MBW3075331.1 TIGR02450 family Trp-rich protein [Prochlorococcus marinus str. MU1417]
MEKFWTSKKPIKGLRHFVLVNEVKEEGNIIFLMVSVIDSEISFKITYEELINSGNWDKGWINLSKHQSITVEYVNYKSSNKEEGIDEIFINEDSLFNIS